MRVLVACSDLMTASRFEREDGQLVRCSSPERLWQALAAARAAEGADSAITIVLDLTAFLAAAAQLRGEHRFGGRVVGFAPHVREDLIEPAREWCDEVVPRGAMVRHFARYTGVQSSAAEGELPA